MEKKIKISKTGYKKGSPDANQPMLRIPSGRITMRGVPYPILGIDNQGNQQLMLPGQEYEFPGASYVDEFPLPSMQQGGENLIPNWVNSSSRGDIPTQTGALKSRNQAITSSSADKLAEERRWKAEINRSQQMLAKEKSLRPIKDRTKYEQEMHDKMRQQKLADWIAKNPEYKLNEFGEPTLSGYGEFIQKYGDNLDKFAGSLETPMAIQGAGDLLYGAGKLGAKYLPQVGEYLTTKTPLRNAYKLNPWAFKPNPEAAYRGIGKAGYEDLIQTGEVRSLKRAAYPEPYFAKGVEPGNYAKGYMIELNPNEPMKGVGAFSNYSEDLIGTPINKITINNPNLKILKQHWLKGYKEVPKPEIYPTIWEDLKGMNDKNIGEILDLGSDVTAGTGQMNFGVFPTKKNPDILVKLENYEGVTRNLDPDAQFISDLPKLMSDINSPYVSRPLMDIDLTGKNILNAVNPDKAKYYSNKPIVGRAMTKVPGKQLDNFGPEDFGEVPVESYQEVLDNLRKLREKNIGMDLLGDNLLYNPETKRFSMIDFSKLANSADSPAIHSEFDLFGLDNINRQVSPNRIKQYLSNKIERAAINRNLDNEGMYSSEELSNMLEAIKNKIYGIKKKGGPVKMQPGGTVPPIYVSDKNDPRLLSYNDSLSLYNNSQKIYNAVKKRWPYKIEERKPFSNESVSKGQRDINPLIRPKFLEKIYPEKVRSMSSDPQIVSEDYINGNLVNKDVMVSTNLAYLFKKPVQPILFRQRPEFKPERINTSTGNINVGQIPIPQPIQFEQSKIDLTKPTKYSFTYPTGHYLEGKTVYFPTKGMLQDFIKNSPNASSQEGEDYMTATGNVEMKKGGGIHINPKNKGKFTEAAKRAGMSVQEFARHVLANKEDYSPTLIKRANFARNAAKWEHEDGGEVEFMKKGGLTPNKARKILHDKKIHGRPLTDKQRRFFGAMSKGNTLKFQPGGEYDEIIVPTGETQYFETGFTPDWTGQMVANPFNWEMGQPNGYSDQLNPKEPAQKKTKLVPSRRSLLNAMNLGMTKLTENLQDKEFKDYERQMALLMNTPSTTRLTNEQQYGNPMAYQIGGMIPDDISYMANFPVPDSIKAPAPFSMSVGAPGLPSNMIAPSFNKAPIKQQANGSMNDYATLIYNTYLENGLTPNAAKILTAQTMHETAGYTSNVFKKNNNVAGLKIPTKRKSKYVAGTGTAAPANESKNQKTNKYARYNTPQESALDLLDLIRSKGIDPNNMDADQYAEALYSKGYYGSVPSVPAYSTPEKAKNIYKSGLKKGIKRLQTLGFKKGGEYELSNKEIAELKAQGYDIEIID